MVKSAPSIFVRTPYNYDRNQASVDSGLCCSDPSLAVQDSRDECDINTIVRRFGVTGHLPVGVRVPSYGDFTGVSDYQSALAALQSAEDSFFSMPADVRKRFDNNPAAFVDFCSDPANLEEMRSLGLAVPPQSEALGDASPKTKDSAPEAPPAQ